MVFEANWDITDEEKQKYVDYVVNKRALDSSDEIKKITLTLVGDNKVDLKYDLQEEHFERIRRITGYLVGTIDRWNNAKKSEESERVKHSAA